MIIRVDLGHHACEWTFRESGRLAAWLSQCPWISGGGVRVVRASSVDAGQELALQLERWVRAQDNGLSGVRPSIIPGAALGDGLVPAVLDLFERPRSLHGFALYRTLAADFSGVPRPIIVEPPVNGAATRRRSEADTLFEMIGKTDPSPPVAIILIDTVSDPLLGDAYDLSNGRPLDGIVHELLGPENVLWSAYVHQRLAWEAGGDLSLAREWNEDVLSLECGSDDVLEDVFNHRAEDRLRRIPKDAVDSLSASVRSLVTRARERTESATLLRKHGLLWPDGPGTWIRPTPWAARALLLASVNGEASSFLRGCLVCAPLAHEVLRRCFEIECLERARCWSDVRSLSASENAKNLYRDFQIAHVLSEARHYPAGCPARPVDEWDFATFGEFLAKMDERGERRELADLRDLRNAIVHGHYVSWYTIATLRRICQIIARR